MNKAIYTLLFITAVAFQAYPAKSAAQELHPLMTSDFWTNVGVYFASRDFTASADGTIFGENIELDFEREFGLDDGPDLFMAEFAWQFSDRWDVALQYFQSDRDKERSLERTFDWEDVTYEAGISLRAQTEIEVIRVVLSRQMIDSGKHRLKIGAGFHWLEIGASLSGEARLADMSTEFRTESVSASAPVPNVGAWYRYSLTDRWLLGARVDWLSASIDEYSGGIWNVSAGANFSFSDHFGAGLAYQFFQLDGSVRNETWRGDLRTRFSGPHLFLVAFW